MAGGAVLWLRHQLRRNVVSKITLIDDDGERVEWVKASELLDANYQLEALTNDFLASELKIFELEGKLAPYEKAARRTARRNKREDAYRSALLQIRDNLGASQEIIDFIGQVFSDNGVKFD